MIFCKQIFIPVCTWIYSFTIFSPFSRLFVSRVLLIPSCIFKTPPHLLTLSSHHLNFPGFLMFWGEKKISFYCLLLPTPPSLALLSYRQLHEHSVFIPFTHLFTFHRLLFQSGFCSTSFSQLSSVTIAF